VTAADAYVAAGKTSAGSGAVVQMVAGVTLAVKQDVVLAVAIEVARHQHVVPAGYADGLVDELGLRFSTVPHVVAGFPSPVKEQARIAVAVKVARNHSRANAVHIDVTAGEAAWSGRTVVERIALAAWLIPKDIGIAVAV